MKTSLLSRFSPLRLRNGAVLKNRVVVPPMASETANSEGFATPATLAHYERLAKSGASLVMVEYTYVHRSGRSEPNQLGIDSDSKVEGLARIAEIIHRSSALAGIQITHSGGKTSRDLTDGSLQSPSGVAVPVKDQDMPIPDAMTLDEIHEWRHAFGQAIERAVLAGFDLVELHAAHGYGLNQWLSPLTNQRRDAFGGNVRKNSRLLLEIVEQAKRDFPGLLLAVRMPGQDFLEGGLTAEDSISIARALEETGIDLIDVSSGIGGWRRPRDRRGEGYLVSEAARIQFSVGVPVIGVGGIETGEYIDRALRSGELSLAAVGRAVLNGPTEWRERVMVGFCEKKKLAASY